MTETLCESPETRFVGLMSELFQLREAEELDFGIYRVIRRHNQKVREFLGEIVEDHGQPVLQGGELAGILEGAFQHIGQETRNEKKLELQRMAEALGIKAHLSADERRFRPCASRSWITGICARNWRPPTAPAPTAPKC